MIGAFNLSVAVVFAVVSTLTLAGTFAAVRFAAASVPIGEIVFFRGLMALPVLLCYAAMQGGVLPQLAVKNPRLHALRALVGGVALAFNFVAISMLSLTLAVVLSYLMPIFVACSRSADEGARGVLIASAVTGFAGVVIILAFQMSVGSADAKFITGVVFGVIGAWLTSISLKMVGRLAQQDSPSAIAFYFAVACMIGGLATWPAGWVAFDQSTAVALVACGIFSAASQIAMTEALARADTARISQFNYLVLIWAALYEVAFFCRIPTWAEVLGATLIIAAPMAAWRLGKKTQV